MPATVRYVLSPTEIRIRDLCAKVAAATTSEEAERVLTELQQAIKDHVNRARIALTADANAIALLNSDD